MPLIKSEVRNLIGGVSQQPPPIRLDNQCESSINSWPSPVDGLAKRQPTQHLKDVMALSIVDTDTHYHMIYRDGVEKYHVLVIGGSSPDIRVFNADTGVEYDVDSDSSGTALNTTTAAYLNGASATDFALHTVADYTFIVNRQTVVDDSTDTTPSTVTNCPSINAGSDPPYVSDVDNECFFFVRQGAYKVRYTATVRIDDVTYTGTASTWDGNTAAGAGGGYAAEISSVRTEDIAAELMAQLDTAGVNSAAMFLEGSVLRICGFSPNSLIQVATCSDSIGDTALSVIFNEVPRVQGYLPEICVHDFKIKVVGDGEIDADDYYVKFQVENAEEAGVLGLGAGSSTVVPTGTPFSRGIWVETNAKGIRYKLDATTMPHQLTREFESDGTTPKFVFAPIAWGERTVGDLDSVPWPSFLGKRIWDTFFYKDRLGFIADDTVHLSETGYYFNLFRTTLLSLRDTAPIDVTLNHEKPAILRWAIPHNEDMVLGSDRSQFVVRGSDILSPRTIQVTPVSEYENLTNVPPISAARSMFVPFKRGNQSGVRELFQVGDVDRFDAVDTTITVPNYIEGEITEMAVTTLEDTLVVLSSNSATELYVYKWLWSGREKIQSAWQKWTLGTENNTAIKNIAFVENTLYLVINRLGRICFEKIELAAGLTDPDSIFTVHLDRRFDQSQLTIQATATITITDFTGLSTFDEVTLTATDGTSYDFTQGTQSSVNGTFEATTSNTQTATNLMNVINTSSGPAGTRFTATSEGAVVTVTQAVGGISGNTEVTFAGAGATPAVGAWEATDFIGGFGTVTSYDPLTDTSTIDPPYSPAEVGLFPIGATSSIFYEFVDKDTGLRSPATVDGINLTVRGDWTSTDFFCGKSYNMDHQLTVPLVKISTQGGTYGEHHPPQKILNGYVQFNDSRVFKAKVKVGARSEYTYVFNGLRPGFSETTVGSIELLTGEFRYPVRGQADQCVITLVNDSPYPSNITAVSWEVRVRDRASRINR